MVGESHVAFAFDPSLQTDGHNQTKYIDDHSKGWKGFCYYDGLTMFTLPNRLENDLQKTSIKISDYKNIVFVFGTNDAIVRRDNPQPPEAYVPRYIEYIESVRTRYDLANAYVTTPFYVQPSRSWTDQERYYGHETRTDLIVRINSAIVTEASKYANVHAVSLTDIFSEGGELFHDKYSHDGVHFNELGRNRFFDVITQAIENKK